MKMKKAMGLFMAASMAISLVACGGSGASKDGTTEGGEKGASEKTAIKLWTYPIGEWGSQERVEGIIANFNEKYPDVSVTVEYLDYTSGDDQVTAAIEAGTTPDIIMEGPERLVSNWGAAGKMVDLTDLWDEDSLKDIQAVSQKVVDACKSPTGVYYEYPLCMNAHSMAINYELFEKADALQYIDQETRTWTTENFQKALEALKKSGVETTGIVYCGGQGGDQGTRALAMNLYKAQFTNADHTKWTMNSEEGIKGLQLIADLVKKGDLSADAGIQAADELQLFANGTAAMTFAWNASNESNYAEQVAFTPYAVAFPSEDGVPELAGGIYGFGIFDNKDEAKIKAAKEFIKFVCDDEKQGPESVIASGFFPVRESFGNVYAGAEDEERMAVFNSFMKYLGDYYNVTPGWAEQRTAWWEMLQKIVSGTDVKEAVDQYVEICNTATENAMASSK